MESFLLRWDDSLHKKRSRWFKWIYDGYFLGEGIGLTATEVINENDQVRRVPLKRSHHHADYAVGYHRDNEKRRYNNLWNM